MSNTIFIKFPWTKHPANEIYVSAEQIKTAYDIIIKAFLYKYKYEQGKKLGFRGIECYDLDNIKVYNSFVNEISTQIYDSTARDYILTTLKNIRENNYNRQCVKQSYEVLFSIFGPEEPTFKDIRNALAKNPDSFIDFCKLFEKCNRTALTVNSKETLEIMSLYKQQQINYFKILENIKSGKQ